MSQFEVPQLSLQRYVELLKRRRWQVVPVSLLGLLVGGVVAFFIPRYFVASAVLAYQQPPGDSPRGNEDPFAAIVESARLTIPRAIGQTIKTLGWEESRTTDPFQLSENIAAIEGRLTVSEANSGKDRPFALIRVTYRDRDGQRAAQFTNALVETWRNQRIEEMKASAEQQRAEAAEKYRQQDLAFDKFLREKQHLETTYGIDPNLDLALQRTRSDSQGEQTQKLGDQLAGKRIEVARLEAQLAQQQKQLERTPARIKLDPEVLSKQAAATEEGKALLLELNLTLLAVERFQPGAHRTRLERYAARLQERLAQLPGGSEPDADGLVANPENARLVEQVAASELALQVARGELGPLEARLVAEETRLRRLAEGYGQYERVVVSLTNTKKALEAAYGAMEAATQMLGRLGNQPTVRIETAASPPPRPTEPNIVLVALLGCVIGLLAATALVLLLDILRGSWKTQEDVERGLPVPVLGGMSHLETVEDRRAVQRSRRRMTLLAATFVLLTSSVVLVFYYDPTRLPPFVRDLLAMVLGAS